MSHSHSGHNHSHDHGHNHSHNHENTNIKVLVFSFILTFIVMFVEFVGGYLTNSLALISDAGHMLSDSISLVIAIWAVYLGNKKSDPKKTFGYKRVETIAAFVNGITLAFVSLVIFKEGITRFFVPVQVQQDQMIVIALIGMSVNLLTAFILYSRSKENLNIKGAFLHTISDLLGSVGAVGAGLIIKYTGWLYADSLISIIIAILIFQSSINLIKDTFNTLMEGTPRNIDFEKVVNSIKEINHVDDIHDLHIWSMNESKIYLTAHVVISDLSDKDFTETKIVREQIRKTLHDNFNIEHSTLEFELTKCYQDCN